jgi:glycosyltransferase involved in cell wall biosynthesis
MASTDTAIRVSLIVPTYNRAERLLQSLRSFRDQSLHPSRYEILVVDNNSTDETREVAHAGLRDAACEWRYLLEPRQGLHCARNRGILEARGEIVVFGDDDIVAAPTWLERLAGEFDGDASVGIVGGKVKPLWDDTPPTWIYDYGSERVHPVFAYLDYGDERLELSTDYVFGCNFAIRRTLAIEIGGSFPDTFPNHLRHLSGTGENGMIDKARRLGYKVLYSPGALVHHYADVKRANLPYFIDRYRRWAIEDAFEQFRQRSKSSAAARLMAVALKRLLRSPSTCARRKKPLYGLAIENAASWQMMRQVVTVLVDSSVYEHITRKSYLGEPTFNHGCLSAASSPSSAETAR